VLGGTLGVSRRLLPDCSRHKEMVFLKSLLAGVVAVVLMAIALPLVMAVYFWIRRPPDTGADFGAVGWDPISVSKPATLFVVSGIFLAGFIWEFFRATPK
jgi:hypothetical protein